MRGAPRSATAAALVSLLLACASCRRAAATAAGPSPADVDAAAAMDAVRALVAIGPRDSGTPGAAKAAAFIHQRLKAVGLDPEIDIFEDGPKDNRLVLRNVYVTIPGSTDDLIILGTHYDTKAGIGADFVGANDGGSGVGVLLEMARLFSRAPRRGPALLFAFFDGEECRREYGPDDGLHGSRRLAARLATDGRAARVSAMILADMVGDADLRIDIPRNSTPSLIDLAFSAAREEGVRDHFSLASGDVLDDHVPFLQLGIPAIDLIDFSYGPPSSTYWHTPEDTMDKLSPESLSITARVMIRMVNRLSEPKPQPR